MNQHYIVQLAAEAGKIILENGGETFRVEETINRICISYDVLLAESFVTPTGIMVSAYTSNGENISIIKRIKKRSVNLEKISKVNELSRDISISKLSPSEFRDKLNEIDSSPPYSLLLTIFAGGMAAGFFTLLFDGSLRDFLVAFFTGLVLKCTTSFLDELNINNFFINIIGGALATIIAILSIKIGIGINLDKIIIGSIMLLVPGIAITNAIRDTIAGDLLAGISRATEAFLIACGIAVGSGIIMGLWISSAGGAL